MIIITSKKILLLIISQITCYIATLKKFWLIFYVNWIINMILFMLLKLQ
jgi:hypothetical protein